MLVCVFVCFCDRLTDCLRFILCSLDCFSGCLFVCLVVSWFAGVVVLCCIGLV